MWTNILSWLSAVKSWAITHWKLVLTFWVILVILLTVLYIRKQNKVIAGLNYQVRTLEATIKVKDLEKDKAVIEQQIGSNTIDQNVVIQSIASINEQIQVLDKKRVELTMKGQGSSDEEIADAFKKLGY